LRAYVGQNRFTESGMQLTELFRKQVLAVPFLVELHLVGVHFSRSHVSKRLNRLKLSAELYGG